LQLSLAEFVVDMAKSAFSKNHECFQASAVDLFCGAGGLTHGLIKAGLRVNAGIDIDPACKYPFEENNDANFYEWDIANVESEDIGKLYPEGDLKVLVGCAPCQPFSKYAQGDRGTNDDKWKLLKSFARIVRDIRPEIISMENVAELQEHKVYRQFRKSLDDLGYFVSSYEVFCPDYGIPQNRTRLVLFASEFETVELVRPTHSPTKYPTVREAISDLPPIEAGTVADEDPLHRSIGLSELNRKRIRASVPGGTWRDWPKSLRAECHRKATGKTYPGVYGRMEWDSPSPTMTTQFYGFGNGRFGHPEQDRGISLREGAILQSFPKSYRFVPKDGRYSFTHVGRLIGNAVPVRLGKVVGRSILAHLKALHG
jgi:DNA (cytosine-5)-methyltransferase 1